MQNIDIEVNGTHGTAYSANWTIYKDGNVYTHNEPDGRVPQRLKFEGDSIEAKVTLLTDGQLSVTVNRAGNLSRSSTQGKNSTLRFKIK